jgi:MFS family permease
MFARDNREMARVIRASDTLSSSVSQAFVSCAWGISNIGYVMICFGVTNAVAALATGTVVKVTGRKPVMVFAFCLHLSILIFMLRWRPTPEQGLVFFVLSGLWGVCDSVWLVQVNGICHRTIAEFGGSRHGDAYAWIRRRK